VAIEIDHFAEEFDPRFKIFHELMAEKVREILLVSTPYDAWIMEEDCRLSERIIHEYRGLNLSHPPRLTWASTAEDVFSALEKKRFDLVLTMPRLADMDAFVLGREIKKRAPDLPVILLSHSDLLTQDSNLEPSMPEGIDRTFVWSGNTDILVALIKSTEDRLNVVNDTKAAGIRVILLVEDSPYYVSTLLPIFYREVVCQTQAVIGEGLNEEHRLLAMRARTKILVADNYEAAMRLYQQFKPYVLGVVSDVRFPRNGKLDHHAGVDLLSKIKKDRWDIPLLLTSSEPSNAEKASTIPASFIDKNSSTLLSEVRSFFLDHLAFGDFVFRLPDGSEVARASSLRSLEKSLHSIPDESFVYHCNRNDFSRWLFTRTETVLASKVRPIRDEDFSSVESHRQYLIATIHARRMRRQKGIVANFDSSDFDLETEFFKIGTGSLGGKARGLAFISSLLHRNPKIQKKFDQVNFHIPQTLVITTEGFDSFIDQNNLRDLAKTDIPDAEVAEIFENAEFPEWIAEDLRAYLSVIKYPLAIRSSSLLEDAQFRAYAGLYRTYMIPNDHPDLESRLAHLLQAIKLVYASTYYQGPKAFSRRVGHHTEAEKMAVIIQKMVGEDYGNSFYPAIAGVAHSHNYYPFDYMKPEEGIATIVLGLGKMVVEGQKALRFSPRYPQLLPQLSTVDDILENSQKYFYALKMGGAYSSLDVNEEACLDKRAVEDAEDELPMRTLASTYIHEEHRIRDTTLVTGYRVLTFSQVLKYDLFPLAGILTKVLKMGQEGMGCPVEFEFAVNLNKDKASRPEFAFLQIRPMAARAELETVNIGKAEIDRAFCFSINALGNAYNEDMLDIIYVKPDTFDTDHTPEIAREISKMNAALSKEKRKYLLIGPGRWGSADRWLGIPVKWADISGVGAMVETTSPKLMVDPSQGSHFFHNLTTLGINYIAISEEKEAFLDWDWITSQPVERETTYVSLVRFDKPITLKVDGRKSQGVIYANL
jgi:CheY-like chemotaxis protein